MRKRILVAVGATLALLGAGTAVPASADVGIVPIAVQAAPPGKPGAPTEGHQVPILGKVEKGAKRASVSAQLLPPDPGNVYYWHGGGQTGLTGKLGASAGMRYNNPYKHGNEYHTVQEVAVIDNNAASPTTLRDIVEIGFGKTLAGCGQIVTPCVWGYHWINGVGQGWNTNFTDYASSFNLGDLPTSAETAGCTSGASARSERYSVRKNDTTGVWMLNVDLCHGDATAGEWIGHYDDALWTAAGQSFTDANEVQVFGEVLHAYAPSSNPDQEGWPCTDSGNGNMPNSGSTYPASGQRIADITMPSTLNTNIHMTTFNASSDGAFSPAGLYDAVPLATEPVGNVRYYNVGGPGVAGANGNTLPGNVGSC